MGIWGIIMLVVCFMSFIMIGFGLWFSLACPKKINLVLGYRTPMSMKNHETWEYGNLVAGKLMWRTGCVLLVGSLIALFSLMSSSDTVIRTVGIIIIIVHAVMIFGTIIISEIKLHKRFDRQGNLKG